jgi:hypothetical protein
VDDCITTGRRRQYSSPTYDLLADLADTNYSIGGDATKRSRRSAGTQETRLLLKCRSHHHGRDDDALLREGERQGGERREGVVRQISPNLNTSLFSLKCMEST